MRSNRSIRSIRIRTFSVLLGAAAALVGSTGVAAADEAVGSEATGTDVEIGDALVIERQQPEPSQAEPIGSAPVEPVEPVEDEVVEIGDALVIERERPEVEIGDALVIEREQPLEVRAGDDHPGAGAGAEPVAGQPIDGGLVEPEVAPEVAPEVPVEIGDALVIEREQPAAPVAGPAPDVAVAGPVPAAPTPVSVAGPGHLRSSVPATSTEVLGVRHTRLAETGAGPLGHLLVGSGLLIGGAVARRSTRQAASA